MGARVARLRALAGRRAAIPLGDLGTLRRAALRTRVLRLSLAAALVAAAVLAVVTAPGAQGRRFLPSKTVGVVVLDLSSSIQPDTFYRIDHELAALAATRQRFGLVVFSDVAYEALPPGTPAVQLKPLLRFFSPQNDPAHANHAGDEQDLTPRSPWEQWFSSGTSISSGLLLAEQVLRHDHVRHPAVLLISDLADDPSDLPKLGGAVVDYAQRGIPLRILALNPSQENLRLIERLLGSTSLVMNARLPTGAEARGTLTIEGTFPKALAAFAALVVVLLALNEWWAEPLRWRRRAAA